MIGCGTGSNNAEGKVTFPTDPCNAVYDTTGYTSSKTNMARNSLSNDMVFSDGYSHQLATVDGNVVDGFTAKLKLGV